MEWIIVDDGTDKIRDLVDAAKIPQIKYFALSTKMPLGQKRNYMHDQCKGSIIVYMDDDDYYPPERVSHAVEKLTSHKDALCAGSSELYVYFKHIHKMYQCGPYGPNHATAGTFAFKSELLKQTRYEDHAALAEEKAFLKNYTIPFVQLDPMKSILVFSHEHNTFDKRRLLENPHPSFMKESPKTVDMFISQPKEAPIKQFFMNDIDALLLEYKPGEPSMKPDVIAQMKEMELERAKMAQQQQQQQQQHQPGSIMLQREGLPPIALGQQDIINIMQQQQQQIQELTKRVSEMTDVIQTLQLQLIAKSQTPSTMLRMSTELNRSPTSSVSDSNQTPSTNISVNPCNITNLPEHLPAPLHQPLSIQRSKSDPEIQISI